MAAIIRLLPSTMKDAFERVPFEMEAYIDDHMNEGPNPNPKVRSGSAMLYVNTGRLRKAVVFKQTGNQSKLKTTGDNASYEFGIDKGVVPYAYIHEYGGKAGRNLAATIPARPYIAPAFSDYAQDPAGFQQIGARVLAAIQREFNRP